MPAVAKIGSVVINTTDVEPLKVFWSALLAVEAVGDDPSYVWLKPQHEGGISVALQKVPDPTPGRRRLHLDTSVANLDEAQDRIKELGGSHVETHKMGDFEWRVMADPDGNEFCIAPEH